MKKRLFSIFLCLCMFLPLLAVPASAAATNISVESVSYYDNGDVESIKIKFGWNSASATSRLAVMTTPLRSAGEAGTDKTYGDFTNYGYYGKSFTSWNKVLEQSSKFGMLYYTDEQQSKMSQTNTITLFFDEGDISLNKNQTYYLYLWTYYQGHYYPDNLFMVLRVKDGTFGYAPATGRNTYGSFTDLWELIDKPSSSSSSSSSSATGSVSLVRATVTAPAVGATPSTTATLPSTASTEIKKVEWFSDHDADTFQAGKTYTVQLTIGMKAGQNKIFNSPSVTVNGKTAKLVSTSADKKEIVISYTFPALKETATTVTNLAITFPTLAVGSVPPGAAQTKVSNSSVSIKDVEWVSDYDGDVFLDNKDYTVYVTVGIKDGVNATFNLSKATIDGSTAKIESVSSNKKEAVISFEFTSKTSAPSFKDVKQTDWFQPYVSKICAAGRMTGKGDGAFDPNGNLSLAEVMVLASNLYKENTGKDIPEADGAWYAKYYSYCQKQGILDGLNIGEKDVSRAATRFEMVVMLDRAASKDKTSGGINSIKDGFIPDLKESATHGEVIYRWYRSGILAGDANHNFNGATNIKRSEVSVILCQLYELIDRAKF